MGPGLIEDEVRGLRERLERALGTGRPRDQLAPMLERLVQIAPNGSDTLRFALRQLAEAQLARAPWRAALYLKRLLALDPRDDDAHALAGLCFALLGHFGSAVASYRRALVLAPGNPWYVHNLGHLLDVTLRRPADALAHLRRAHRLEPAQVEVVSSLAHCLASLGKRDEALALLRPLGAAPHTLAEVRALLAWVEQGALPEHDRMVPGLLSSVTLSGGFSAPPRSSKRAPQPTPDPRTPRAPDARDGEAGVVALLAASYARARYAPEALLRARRLWSDYARAARPTLGRAAVYAASVEYALSRIDGVPASQRALAERYGVSVSSLQTRYAAVRTVLRLTPSDPRYARHAAPLEAPVRGGATHARAVEDPPLEH